jgi:hypothetical protein
MAQEFRDPSGIFDIGFPSRHGLNMLGIDYEEFALAFEHIIDWAQ